MKNNASHIAAFSVAYWMLSSVLLITCWLNWRDEADHLSVPVLHSGVQAESAKLIGEAVQQNPSFLTLRKIEVRRVCKLMTVKFRWTKQERPFLARA